MIQSVIQAIGQLNAIQSADLRFKFPCPVCWFGNLNSDKPIILTMGINPSDKEFKDNRFRGFKDSWSYANPQDCINAYNGYFKGDPYTKWFDEQEAIINCKSSHAQHSKAIKFLSRTKSLDASYYDDTVSIEDADSSAKYQLVHVDLFPFASAPTWRMLKLTRLEKSLLFAFGMQLVAKIIETVKPKLILSFGGFPEKKHALEKYFGQDFEMIVLSEQKIPEDTNARRLAEGSIKINDTMTPIIFTTAIAADAYRIKGLNEHMEEIYRRAEKYLNS